MPSFQDPSPVTTRVLEAFTPLLSGPLRQEPAEEIYSALIQIPLPFWRVSFSHTQSEVTCRITAAVKDQQKSVKVELCQITTFPAGVQDPRISGHITLKIRSPREELSLNLARFPLSSAAVIKDMLPLLGEAAELERLFSRANQQAELYVLDRECTLKFVRELLEHQVVGVEEGTPYELWRDHCDDEGRDVDDVSFEVVKYGQSRCYTTTEGTLLLSAALMRQVSQHGESSYFPAIIAEFHSLANKRVHTVSVSLDFYGEESKPLINLANRDSLLPSERN